MSSQRLNHAFIEFCIQAGVLKFGQFKLKSGRMSPYFFNAGLFNDGQKLERLAGFYAQLLTDRHVEFDMIFGPAYKGIPLAATIAVELARRGKNTPVAYNRKEAKDHGEGGNTIGAPIEGRVLIVDDVISAGTAVRESVSFIQKAGAQPVAVAIALDRQEKGADNEGDLPYSAVQYVEKILGVTVYSVATLTDLFDYLRTSNDASLRPHAQAVTDYRNQYGVV